MVLTPWDWLHESIFPFNYIGSWIHFDHQMETIYKIIVYFNVLLNVALIHYVFFNVLYPNILDVFLFLQAISVKGLKTTLQTDYILRVVCLVASQEFILFLLFLFLGGTF